ncbi:hypothetical protein PsorP6_014745 [Peronosclerospora sorghi]|uniref:Uncharacterized protein n=1 Tax=Peronosclerospora sorghi TaxID=230839 RepID=A0ACC0VT02_9STRA|nr:hypothetical protein PsorP6_014745 [Peronosclerospora sorghi]
MTTEKRQQGRKPAFDASAALAGDGYESPGRGGLPVETGDDYAKILDKCNMEIFYSEDPKRAVECLVH